MAYNSKYTGAQVEALLDRAGAAPQTYDIGWLMNLISTSGNGTVTLTAEQFNEVKAAADAHKIFVAYSMVYSSGISIDGGNTSIVLATLSGGYVTTFVVSSLNGTYKASLTGNQIVTQNDLSGFAKASDVPKKTSQLTNDSGFATRSDIDEAVSGKVDKVAGKGLSTNDYTDEEKAKVASALQGFTETDPTVPSWAKQSTKPSYTASEVGALPSTTKIPSKTSDLSNDSGFLTSHQTLKTINGNSIVGAGDITIGGGIEAYDVTAIIRAAGGDRGYVSETVAANAFAAARAKKLLYFSYTLANGDEATACMPYTILGLNLILFEITSECTFLVHILKDTGYVESFYNEVPSNTSDLTNDSGFLTSAEVDAKIAAIPSANKRVVKIRELFIGFDGTSYYDDLNIVTLASTEFAILGRAKGLDIALPDGSDSDGKEYVCQFYVGGNGDTFSLTLPDSVVWLNGKAPTIESNSCYILSIVNNCAVIGMFKQSS